MGCNSSLDMSASTTVEKLEKSQSYDSCNYQHQFQDKGFNFIKQPLFNIGNIQGLTVEQQYAILDCVPKLFCQQRFTRQQVFKIINKEILKNHIFHDISSSSLTFILKLIVSPDMIQYCQQNFIQFIDCIKDLGVDQNYLDDLDLNPENLISEMQNFSYPWVKQLLLKRLSSPFCNDLQIDYTRENVFEAIKQVYCIAFPHLDNDSISLKIAEMFDFPAGVSNQELLIKAMLHSLNLPELSVKLCLNLHEYRDGYFIDDRNPAVAIYNQLIFQQLNFLSIQSSLFIRNVNALAVWEMFSDNGFSISIQNFVQACSMLCNAPYIQQLAMYLYNTRLGFIELDYFIKMAQFLQQYNDFKEFIAQNQLQCIFDQQFVPLIKNISYIQKAKKFKQATVEIVPYQFSFLIEDLNTIRQVESFTLNAFNFIFCVNCKGWDQQIGKRDSYKLKFKDYLDGLEHFMMYDHNVLLEFMQQMLQKLDYGIDISPDINDQIIDSNLSVAAFTMGFIQHFQLDLRFLSPNQYFYSRKDLIELFDMYGLDDSVFQDSLVSEFDWKEIQGFVDGQAKPWVKVLFGISQQQ